MNHQTTHMERRKICVIEIGRSDVVVTSMIVVCLLLCALNLMNGQQFVYGLLQRGSPEAGQHVIEPGSHIGGILKGPKPFPGAPGSNIEQGERENNIGPAGPNPSLGPRPGSSEQGEIRRNVGPSAPLNPNATQHIVVPLPPKNVDNNIVIGNKVIRSEPLIVENVRQPFITTSQPAEQEAVMIPPPPIYESPPPPATGETPSETNVILGPPVPSSSVGQVDSQGNSSTSSIDTNTTTIANSQSQYLIPIANPGPNLTVRPSQLVFLDGSKSYDPNGDPLYFLWLQLTGGPTVPLLNSTTPSPSFRAPTITNTTTLTFELLVGDGQRGSMPSYTYVTVEP